MKPTLHILAAGMGSRYGGLKQLDKLGPSGETILDYSVYDAIRSGFGKVVFIIRHEIEKEFKAFFDGRFGNRIAVEYVYQELNKLPDGFIVPDGRTKPWGTAHAMLMARNVINEPFVVINADDFYGTEAFRLLADFLKQPQTSGIREYALAGYKVKNTLSEFGGVSRGVCAIDSNHFLQTVTETHQIRRNGNGAIGHENPDTGWTTLNPETLVSMNTWAFGPEIFDDIEVMLARFLCAHGQEQKSEFYIPTIADNLITGNKAHFKVIPTDAQWFGVTYIEDRPTAVESIQRLVDQGIYPENLWK